ncbi:MAG: cation:proton antiporter [Planctomycetota bacterium]
MTLTLGFGCLMLLLCLCAFLCLYRVAKGPTAPDRTVAIDILGTLMVGFCAVMALATGQAFYLTIALTWGLVSFIGALALAKYLEGRPFDD